MGVHEFPILNPLPNSQSMSSLWIPCTSPKHPVSCIKHRPAIHFLYDSIHVSVPFPRIMPPSPSPSPSESKSAFYTSVSLLLPCIQGYHYHLSKFHIYVFSSVSRSVLSDYLRPHESQHARPPCPSPSPGVHSDSRPSSP